jgi:SAM-dependent methyltransferase
MEKAAYQTTYENEKKYWWYRARADIVSHLFLSSAGRAGAEILNIGCGTGLVSQKFSNFGAVTSLDYSNDALGFCVMNNLEDLVQADGPDLPLRDDSFDFCLALDVLEHIKDDGQTLREIARALKPGAGAVITVPAFQWMWSRMDDFGHLRRYTRKQLKDLIEGAGLQVSLISYYNFLLFPLALLQRGVERVRPSRMTAGEFLPRLPGFINEIFYFIFRLEKHLLGVLPLPFGFSVIAVVKKNRG